MNALFFIFAPPNGASAAERSPAHSPVASEAPPEAATLKLLRRYRAPLVNKFMKASHKKKFDLQRIHKQRPLWPVGAEAVLQAIPLAPKGMSSFFCPLPKMQSLNQ